MENQHNHPAAYCKQHGIFPATAFAFTAMRATFEGCQVTCPTCGAACEVLSGSYEMYSGGLRFIADPSISVAGLNALVQIAKRLEANEISLEDAAQRAEEISPRAGKFFANLSEQTKGVLLAALISGGSAIVAQKLSPPPVVNVNFSPVLERVIETPRAPAGKTPRENPKEPQSSTPSQKPKSDH